MPTVAEAMQTAVAAHRAGDLQQAERIYRQVLQVDPHNADALHLLGMVALQVGNAAAAAECIERAIALDDSQAAFFANLAEAYRLLGRRDQAVEFYRRAIAKDPSLPEPHNNLGTLYQDLRRADEARACFEEAVRLKPSYAQAHNNLGSLFHDLGRLDEAERCYRRAVRTSPSYAQAHNSLGTVLFDGGRLAEAAASFQQALALDPRMAEAHNNLGNVFKKRGQLDEAKACYQRSVAARPDFAAGHFNLGALLQVQNELYESMLSLQRAVALQPNFPAAHNSLGYVLHSLGKMPEAIASIERAIAQEPGLVEAHCQLGAALQADGQHERSLAAFARAYEMRPNDGLKIRMALSLPVIADSVESMLASRRKIEENVATLAREDLVIDDPIEKVAMTNFYLAYQGLDDRALQERIARLHARATRSLSFTAPHCLEPAARVAGQPIRLGFISRHFFDHTIGKLYGGLIRNIARDDFHVTLIRVPGPNDEMAQEIEQSADAVLVVSPLFETARREIADLKLDILFYPDIGMDVLTNYLAFARLANVQCTSWGHPVTTGIPTIDYFISSEGLEPPDAAEHYSETLVKLSQAPTYYARPKLSGLSMSRADFGLPADDHLYVCPQSLFKMHPEFDAVWGAILERDPRGRIVLVTPTDNWTKLLASRLRRSIGSAADRITFLPRQRPEHFSRLLGLADVLLDTIHFGGGNTTFEALAQGTPIVTWPGRFMRGRVTYACYRQMDVHDCIASDLDDYAAIAVRLATDPDYRRAVSEKILGRNDAIFETLTPVRELEQFLRTAVAERAS